jgi:AAA domain
VTDELGLHVERSNGEVLFAPLTPDVDDVALWVEETLAAWGSRFPTVFFDPDAIGAVVQSLEDERAWLAGNKSHALKVSKLDTSRSRPPRWVWKDWLLLGYLNLLIGNEGVGKGTLMCNLLAKVTRGTLPGNLYGEPSTVAIIGDEDSFDDVWAPRLVAAGVDQDRVVQLERPDGGLIELKADQFRISKAVRDHEIKFLFLDALLDNLGAGTDDWRQKPVREALAPARWLARTLDIAVMGSLHPNKRGESFDKLVAGSRAFNSVSRSSILLARNPDDAGRVVMMRGKGNLAKEPTPMDFAIESAEIDLNGHAWNLPRATDFRESGVQMDDLLKPDAQPSGGRKSSKRELAAKIIAEALKDGDWHESGPIRARLIESGVSESMMTKARGDVGVEHESRGMPARTYWRLPEPGLSAGV